MILRIVTCFLYFWNKRRLKDDDNHPIFYHSLSLEIFSDSFAKVSILFSIFAKVYSPLTTMPIEVGGKATGRRPLVGNAIGLDTT